MSRVLAFDTSGPWCAAALLIDGHVVASRHEDMTKGQAERLMPMLEEVLADVGAVWDELDAVGVGVGPGNFTGLRIGVSAARGLALGLKIRGIGVTSFEAMRGSALINDPKPMLVSVASKSRNADVFVQYFQAGQAQGAPREMFLFGERMKSQDIDPFPAIAHCLGAEADVVDWVVQREKGGHTFLEFGPDYRQVTEIAKIAAQRLKGSGDNPRPAPLYIRPADAAPSSDPPPNILP